MKSSLASVRSRILLPVVVAVVATFLATMVMMLLLRSAARKLDRVEREDFPAFRVSQELRDSLARLHVLLEHAATSHDAGDFAAADALSGQILEKLSWEGIAAYGQSLKEEIRAQYDEYFTAARAVATGKSPGGGDPEQLYASLQAKLDGQAKSAQATIRQGFAEARARQDLSLGAGAGILLLPALASLVFAWFFSGKISAPIHELSEAALRVAGGDLRADVQATAPFGEIALLASSFQRMVVRLRELVSTLKSAAEEMASAAEELTDHTHGQSMLLEQQAAAVAETSTTTRELEQTSSLAATRAASVLEVAKRAAQTSTSGQEAAERSAEEMQRIQGSVEGIVGKSTDLLKEARQIGEIVETVRDLASQSHVLSLNASIEAARAGEAGRGFAVVAQEVRALADQSGQGAARIAKMVGDMLRAVRSTRDMTEAGARGMGGSLEQIRASGDSLRQVGAIVQETSEAALQIATAVQQQSKGVAQIALAMRDLDKGMEDAVGRVRSLELSAQRVAETAMQISDVAAEFQI